MSIVSNNIKYIRRQLGLTQEQFSRKIGIKRSLLGAYEEARANPNQENMMNIASIFGITVDQFLKTDLEKAKPAKTLDFLDIPPKPVEEIKVSQTAGDLLHQLFQPETDLSVSAKNNTAFPNPVVFEPLNKGSKNFQSFDSQNSQLFDNQPSIISKMTDKGKSASVIEWVSQTEIPNYLNSYAYPDYLSRLPALQLPLLPAGNYRAFEAGADFMLEGTTLVGQALPNWYDLKDGQPYIIVIHKKGIVYRRVYNQVKIKGVLLLTSDNPQFPPAEVPIKDVLETWEVKLFISSKIPQNQNSPVLDRLEKIVNAMQEEIRHLKQ
jgi:transcriptional regulator with XRE-family HTH domain